MKNNEIWCMQGEIFFRKAAISSGNSFAILGALGKVLSSCVLKQWSRVGEDFEQHQGKKLVILKNIHPWVYGKSFTFTCYTCL